MTSTATLQAAPDVMGNKDPSIGYSVAYPFGVIGPILCIYFMTRLVQPKFPPKEPQMHMGRNYPRSQLEQCHLRRPAQGSAERRSGHNGQEKKPERCSVCRSVAR